MKPNDQNTINSIVAGACKSFAHLPAFSAYVNKTWTTLTYAQFGERVKAFSLGLQQLGVQHGDRVAIVSENRMEWAIADLAILGAGAVTVPIYPSLPEAQVAYILSDSSASLVIVSESKQLKKVQSIASECPDLKTVVVMEEKLASDTAKSFQSIIDIGMASPSATDQSFESRSGSVTPDDLMSIIYTSGTTGNPKGAMLTHANMVCGVNSAADFFPFKKSGEFLLSFLPLCHVFERVTFFLTFRIGGHTVFNDSIFKLMDNIATWKPTVMQCVPRVFESVHERVLETVKKHSENRQKMFDWAVRTGAAAAKNRNAGRRVSPLLSLLSRIADRLVLSKIRAKFGGRLKFFVSGGAPLHASTFDFFQAVGIPILEGWGLTETTAAVACNPFGGAIIGTVGIADFGSNVRTAEDGELLVRGGGVMRGYWKQPEATANAIDPQGWFHTGDLGSISSDGHISITGRKKDIIVLGNGKNVAPQPIESRIKESQYISEIVLLGDNSSTISAVVIPNFDRLREWAGDHEIEGDDKTIVKHADIRKLIKSEIDKHSDTLADFEKIKKFELLPAAFTVDSGELTPTLKVKRNVVADKYGRIFE